MKFSTKTLLAAATVAAGSIALGATAQTADQANSAKADRVTKGAITKQDQYHSDSSQLMMSLNDEVQQREYTDEVGESLDRTEASLKAGDAPAAAEALRQAAEDLRSEAQDLDNRQQKQKLMMAADRLERQAKQIDTTGKADEKQLKKDMAQTSRDLSDVRYERGSDTWTNRDQERAERVETEASMNGDATYRERAERNDGVDITGYDNTIGGAGSDIQDSDSFGSDSPETRSSRDFSSAADYRERAAKWDAENTDDWDADLAEADREYVRDLRVMAGRVQTNIEPANPNDIRDARESSAAFENSFDTSDVDASAEIDRQKQEFEAKHYPERQTRPVERASLRDRDAKTTVELDVESNADEIEVDVDKQKSDKMKADKKSSDTPNYEKAEDDPMN